MSAGDVDRVDLDEDQARASVERAKRGLEAAADEIVAQISGRAWLALGYSSWDEMRQAEYGGAAVIVPRADRPELSARLAALDLSQQQVAQTLGVGEATVSRDLAGVFQTEDVPTRTDSLGRAQPRTKPRDPAKVTTTTRTTEATKVECEVDLGSGEIKDDSELDASLEAEMAKTDSRFRLNFDRALAKSDDLWSFDLDRVAELYSADFDKDLRPWMEEMTSWCDRVTKACRQRRSNLRVVEGRG